MKLRESKDETQPRKRKARRAGIFISKQTLDTILHQKHRHVADMIALLTFYHYTALWQCTNQPRAARKYVMKGLKWGRDKVDVVRSLLWELRLIEDIRATDSQTGRVTGWFVRLPYFHPTENADGGTTSLKTPLVVKSDTNALRAVKPNALRSGTLNTGTARSDCSTRKVKSKSQRPASPGLEGKQKDSDWLQRTPLHVLKRRREKYQNERSQLLREYGNGASSDREKLDRFRRDAPPAVQQRYDWLRPKIEQIDHAIADRSRP